MNEKGIIYSNTTTVSVLIWMFVCNNYLVTLQNLNIIAETMTIFVIFKIIIVAF